eukprot:CAMPEP_0196651574 /NCGR_PEP_ID=MMETSP1086-20130531/574_1 /TAXON_ID=77921 /ORGANISM="Cyanoptyche  gloeocystis , Strain SAG4.97" /LENGTH=73 /DNA_ID=CAMNT_0041981649 /DNA_START=174 /DNA_END=392 /DNA_ORIENTATION=-
MPPTPPSDMPHQSHAHAIGKQQPQAANATPQPCNTNATATPHQRSNHATNATATQQSRHQRSNHATNATPTQQ